MHTDSFEINLLETTIETKLKHSYLEKFIKKPIINKEKLFLFNHLYNQVNIPWTDKESIITTVFLVDMALSTHDSIPSCRSNETMDETELQLSVLAGDYYSAQYYYMLSQLNDIKLTNVLATTIKKISEHKVMLFYNEFESIEDYFDVLKETEGLFYETIATYLNKLDLIPIAKEYLFVLKLYKEKELLKQDNYSLFKQHIEKDTLNFDHSTAFSIINDEIEKSSHKIDVLASEFSFEYMDLKRFFSNKLSFYYQTNRSIAEEG